MHIAVTGATGFVGRRLTEQLEGSGHRVLRLSRSGRKEGERKWDPMAGAAELTAEPAIDGIVHLAGEPVSQRWTGEVKQRIRDSRVVGTRNLVEGIAKLARRPKVLVSASAVGLYGDRGDEWLAETATPGSGFLADVCREWEEEADRAEGLGVRLVKVRIGLVLGQEGGALKAMLPAFRLGAGARLGNGKQWMSWIHIDDMTGMIRYALENENARGAWNATAPQPETNAEFTRKLAAAVHRPALFAAPRWVIALGAGEMSQILFHSQRCRPAAAEAAGYRFRHPELGAALRDVLL